MSSEAKLYPMSLSRQYFLFSWGVFAFMVAVFVGVGVLLSSIPSVPPYSLYFLYVIAPMILCVFPAVYVASPRALALTDTTLTVKKWMGPVELRLTDITGARVEELSGVIRVMGVGGFYGAWGEMKCKELDSFEGYLTRSKRYVVLERKGQKPLVVTPNNANDFVQDVIQRLS